jgi:hypothetical protein
MAKAYPTACKVQTRESGRGTPDYARIKRVSYTRLHKCRLVWLLTCGNRLSTHSHRSAQPFVRGT